jgi:hypothetical protein
MKLTDAERLPCGCIIGTAGEALAIEPCSAGCQYFQYFLAEAARQGKPIQRVADVAEPTPQAAARADRPAPP